MSIPLPDVFKNGSFKYQMISSIDMHTCGEPTRIIYQGYPATTGRLLGQRAQAKDQYDHIRRQLMLEPRGHADMYGAILRQDTELVASGEAHIGVLFMHNEGYSTACGHGTIALGRFLVDTHDLSVFPNRNQLTVDAVKKTVQLNLHPPCGLVRVTVPTTEDGSRADASRPVSFLSTPSFASGIQVRIPIPESLQWAELGARDHVIADFAYGGTMYCIVEASQLGFSGPPSRCSLDRLDSATKQLRAAALDNKDFEQYFTHPEEPDLGRLYGVVVSWPNEGVKAANCRGVETGLCLFAEQQVDRSPCGTAVCARVALAYAKGEMGPGDGWTYHSVVSNAFGGQGGFVGRIDEVWKIGGPGGKESVQVKVEGTASYINFSQHVIEDDDEIGSDGIKFDELFS